jgi:RHS repeat-associated protein
MKEESALGGIYDFNARMYDPAIGRFLSADTIVPGAGDPQSFNRFAFVRNNPLKYVDPSGHEPVAGFPLPGSGDEDDDDPFRPPPLCPPICPNLDPLSKQQESLQVDQTVVVPGPGGPVMAKGNGKSVVERLRSAADAALLAIGVCSGPLKILCSEAAREAAQKTKEIVTKVVEKAGPKTSAGLAEAMTRWFGPKDNVFLRNNPNLRPTWATDAQLNEYLQVARDILDKYAKNPEKFAREIQIQTERATAILKELAQREAERGGQ